MKHQLNEKIFQTTAYLNHPKHHSIYDALQESMQIDELDAQYGSTKPSHNKITHDDQDPEDHEGEKSNERRRKEELPIQSWFNELVDAGKEPEEHEYKDGSVTQFAFELLKGTCKNSIELEYNMDQCSLALTDKIDWINPEGDRFHQDLSKPLPLTGPPSKKRIPVNYFFNHDLEYLVKGSKERTYALFITKIKATRYEDEGIEEMIPSLWSPSIQKYNRDAEIGICHWYPSR
ncbi:hypothetical protein Tco_1550695 [Tanacetum coccineum]